MSRLTRILLATAVVTSVLGAGFLWRGRVQRAVEPPLPGDARAIDSEVMTLIQETHARVRAAPRDASGWAILGMVYEANGLIGLARTSYEETVRLDDDEARWWYRLAIVQGRLGDVDAALQSIAQASEHGRGYAPVHWRRGFWLFDRGDLDAAEAAFRRATEVDAGAAAGWAGLARVWLQREQPARAIEMLEKLLAEHPGDRYALQLLGTAYRQLGQVDAARAALAAGGAGEPVWLDPWTDELTQFQRGYGALLKAAAQHFLNGRLDQAIDLYVRLRQESPDDLALLNQLASAYLLSGRLDEGQRVLEDALALDADHAETHVNLASAALRRGDPAGALVHVDRAISLNPRLAKAYETKGMILWRGDRREPAIAAFRDARRHDPRNVMALVWTGMIQQEQDRWSDALASFEDAAERAPLLTDAWLGIAMVTLNQGALEQAEAALARAAQLDPQNPQVRAGLAQLDELRAAGFDEGAPRVR